MQRTAIVYIPTRNVSRMSTYKSRRNTKKFRTMLEMIDAFLAELFVKDRLTGQQFAYLSQNIEELAELIWGGFDIDAAIDHMLL